MERGTVRIPSGAKCFFSISSNPKLRELLALHQQSGTRGRIRNKPPACSVCMLFYRFEYFSRSPIRSVHVPLYSFLCVLLISPQSLNNTNMEYLTIFLPSFPVSHWMFFSRGHYYSLSREQLVYRCTSRQSQKMLKNNVTSLSEISRH